MAARSKARFLATDIWDTPDDGNRYEVIGGELYVTPPPRTVHQSALGVLHWYLFSYVKEHPIGRVLFAPVGVILDDENGVQPDLVYVARERESIIGERAINGAPDLVVEVLSPSTRARDRGIKMRRYAAAGVSHYWMLDPRSRSLQAYRLGKEGYESVGAYAPGSLFAPETFPGLEIPVAELWD
jgi:Uma2 family endonuclease